MRAVTQQQSKETIQNTGFELVEYSPAHAIEILTNGARQPEIVLDEASCKFVNEIAGKGPCATGLFDGKPVSCGGFQISWPGMAEVWALNVSDIGKYPIDPQIAKKWIYEKIAEYHIVRLQTPLKKGFPAGVKYTEWLGFEYEATLKKYHRDGTDALMYIIITEGDDNAS